MTDREYDRNRLKNLIHYVIWVAGARANFGATKLNKVAWFSDARQFVLTGESITGAPYIREKHGPIPRDGMALREELAREGLIEQWKDRHFNHEGWKFRALQPPMNLFTPQEKGTIDYWIKHIDDDHTATSVSDLSHNYGWDIARMGETIPFHSLLSDRIRDPNEDELRWATEVVKRSRLL
ncbi:MAG: Panacea domain-containing protein [Rhizobiaceae bacterium]|nr:Panacea domain-containing protein [Rhizobiaceae bacterium]